MGGCIRRITNVSNAFRLLGSGELTLRAIHLGLAQMLVSNAFRLLGSGELAPVTSRVFHLPLVSNAFRLLGSGEQEGAEMITIDEAAGLKCLSAFGFWGTQTQRSGKS